MQKRLALTSNDTSQKAKGGEMWLNINQGGREAKAQSSLSELMGVFHHTGQGIFPIAPCYKGEANHNTKRAWILQGYLH